MKNLIINDSKAKFILLLLLFLLISILFEAVYDLNNNFFYNINYYYKEFTIPYFYFFGTPLHLSKVELEFVCIGVILSSFLLIVLCFILYKKNKQTKVKFLENVISLFSKVKIELTLILILILLILRFHAFTSNKMFYN
ncbi:sensor histidine kinase, partial [Clostridioides difficile]|nr:sensor histidine kinase [Clostridioides difficile]